MAFIDPTILKSSKASASAITVASAQRVTPTIIRSASTGSSTNLTTSLKSIGRNTVTQLAVVGQKAILQQGVASLSTLLSSTLASTFGSKTGLATGISPAFKKTFGNTNIPGASTITRLTSDPVSTNLVKQSARSTPFGVTSLNAGSQTLGITGASTSTDTLAALMIGTAASTLLNRNGLDNLQSALSATANKFASGTVNGLFGNLAASVGSELNYQIGGATGATIGSLAASTVAQVGQATAVSLTGTNLVPRSPRLTPPTYLNNPNNDLALFNNQSSRITSALPGLSETSSSYYTPYPDDITLLDQDNRPVYTNRSGIDADTANAIVDILERAGCDAVTGSQYSSASSQASLFSLGLQLASANGINSLLAALLGCRHTHTSYGQTALRSAFMNTAGSQLSTASLLLDGIDDPITLNTSDTAVSIFSNQGLTPSDVIAVNHIYQAMGTTTLDAYKVPSLSSGTYPVYDTNLLASSPSDFVDASFDDTLWSTVYSGSPMETDSFGQLIYT